MKIPQPWSNYFSARLAVYMYMYWHSLGITFENSLISFRVDSFWACCHVGKNIHSCIINLHMHLIKKFALIVLNTSVLYMSCTSVHCIYILGLLHIAYLDNLRWYILHLRTWAKNLFKCFCFRKFKVLKMGIFTHKVQGSISSHVFFIIGQLELEYKIFSTACACRFLFLTLYVFVWLVSYFNI